ncbi:helix-turn-helix transcriptional regulator [Streptomyces griseochromogenes]|uniref:helix-turn-helix transcriptional regulator n=1 Tax=Streptomyces griseochromogenes TaxID=68214 RepID=UPI0037A4B94B
MTWGDARHAEASMTAKRRGLAEQRAARGYSQEEFAALLGVATSTVVRWEGGHSTPRPYQRPKIAKLLGVTAADLDGFLVAVTTVTPQDIPIPASLGDPDDMRRRDLLGLLAATGALITLPEPLASASARQESATVFETGEAMIEHLWQVYGLTDDKSTVYPVIRHQLALLAKSLVEVRSEIDRKRLRMQVGNLYQLAGELFFDARDDALSAHCYTLAANAAKEARMYDLWACAMTRHAYVELYADRAASAAPLLSAASNIARRGDSTLSTRYWVSAVQAEVHAALGDVDACSRALDTAEEVHTLDGQLHHGGWLRFDGSRLCEERGACYVTLGRPDLAEEALASALAQELSPRRRGAVLADLATLGAHRGDIDQLVHYADQALTVAGQTHSGYVGAKLHGLRSRLAGLPADTRISELHEKIAALPSAA